MQQPTLKQKRFAEAYKVSGNATQAAKIAYETENTNTAACQGYQNLKKDVVRQLIHDYAPKALTNYIGLAERAKKEEVRERTNYRLLQLSGYSPIERKLTMKINLFSKNKKTNKLKTEYEHKLKQLLS